MSFLNLVFVVALALGHAYAQSAPTINVSPGVVNGLQCSSGTANSFRSIPYALPPTGDRRFAPPVAYTGNYQGGSLDATVGAPACIQFGSEFVFTGPQSEDCLYLDVWTPANATATSNLPVKVWIYGGGNEGGSISDPLYGGCNLATDAVVVSVAYRVGALGFLSLESAGISGNFAVQDILLGLQWVHDNVAAFGGNPRQVLLFGESAGAGLTWLVSALPQASSLISAVISQSGAGRKLVTCSDYQAYGQAYAKALGCSTTDAACFRAKSTQALNASEISAPPTVSLTRNRFQSCLDGKIIPADPLTTGSKVPFLAGTNTQEGNLFVLSQFGTHPATATDYTAFLDAEFGASAPSVQQTYPLSRFAASPAPASAAISTIITAATFFCPTRRALTATLHGGQPAWTYLDAHTPSCSWEPALPPSLLALLGPTHSSELPLVFAQDTNLPLPNGTCALSAQEVAVSNTLVAAWTSMAAVGAPGGSWPPYDVAASRGLLIGNGSAPGLIDGTVCAFWDGIAVAMAANGTGAANASGSATPSATASGATGKSTSAGSLSVRVIGSEVVVGFVAAWIVLLYL